MTRHTPVSLIRKGKLTTGRVYVILDSAQKALTSDQGRHHVLVFPVDPDNLSGESLKRSELTPAEIGEAFAAADAAAAKTSLELGRAGYYRIEANGPATASRDTFHLHIICGTDKVKFRRCVDSIAV